MSGVGNWIKWRDITRHELALVSLANGNEFVHTRLPRNDLTARIELPTTFTGDLSYNRDKWSAYSEYSDGLGGTNFRAGMEYRLGWLELRGAGRYSNGDWFPSAGAGFNLKRNFAVDVGLYGTRTFLERDSHVGMAVSLRIDRR